MAGVWSRRRRSPDTVGKRGKMRHLTNLVRRRIIPTFLACAVPLFAQGTATVWGTIQDATGASVAKASVAVRNERTGQLRTTVPSETGSYLVALLPVGSYSIKVEAPGFKQHTRAGISLSTDENARIDVVLEVGDLTQSVTVTGDATLVETRSANHSLLVDSARMRQLPLNGRNPLQLQLLLPGVVSDAGSGGAENRGVSINGSRGTMNNYTLDGGSAVDTWTNAPAVMPSPEALEEFSIVQFSLSAEFGRSAGGTINAITKSGTNTVHGALFEFLRNNNLNARNFFAARREVLRQNQFGAAVGGPVIRNKTFFFGSYQGTIQRFASVTTISSVPSDAERQGDFSQAVQRPIDPSTGQRFPDDRIPATRIDPVASRFIERFLPKSPNGLRGPFRYNFPRQNDLHQYVAKIDHVLTGKNRLTGRFFYNNNVLVTDGGLPSFVNHPGDFRTRSLAIADAHTFSGSLINDFRFGYIRVAEVGFPLESKSWAELGAKIAAPEVNGKTWLSLGTQDFFADARRSSNEQRKTYQFADTVNYIRGRHFMKFGFESRRMIIDAANGTSAGGAFSFGAQFSRVGFGDFLLGLPLSFTQNAPNLQLRRAGEHDFFFQDDFKLKPRLTINIGLRYEPRIPARVDNGWLGTIRLGQKSSRFPNAPVGLVFVGDDGVPEGVYRSDMNNLAPRAGFAWDVQGNGRTSVRGGYGLFYDNIRSASIENLGQAEPFNRRVLINAPGSFQDPYGASRTPNPFPFDDASRNNPNFVFTRPSVQPYFDWNFRIGYIQQWMLSVERQVKGNALLRLAYAGSKGTKLWLSRESNPAIFVPGASTVANIDARRILAPNFAGLDRSESSGTSNYHSLQVTFNKRYSQGFTVLTSYTWSKSIDLISRGRSSLGQPNPFNPRLNRGTSDFDVRHVYVGSFVWDLPFLRSSTSALARIAGGWQLNGILNLRSGLPITVLAGRATSLSGTGGERADALGRNPFLPGGRPRNEMLSRFFDTSAFAIPADGSWGNSGRNVLYGPSLSNIDLALVKNFRIFEGHLVEFRGETFNTLNHANFNNPNAQATSPAFGRILSAQPGRVIQLALKYTF